MTGKTTSKIQNYINEFNCLIHAQLFYRGDFTVQIIRNY